MMIKRVIFAGMVLLACHLEVSAQPDRWQQRVKYTMDVNMDVKTNRFTGNQTLAYTNNSPDTLFKVFYHLYWNAFQPGSMMDTRSRELGKITYSMGRRGGEQQDWDPRVRDRILHLKPDEIGYDSVVSLTMNGVPQTYKTEETILEVELSQAHTAKDHGGLPDAVRGAGAVADTTERQGQSADRGSLFHESVVSEALRIRL